MDYKKLCEVYLQLEQKTKRLEKTRILADFLKSVPDEIIEQIILLVQGIVYPVWDERKLGFSSNYVIKALSLTSGVSADAIKDIWRETGDLGNCASILSEKKKQATLFSQTLTVKKVFTNLRNLADVGGEGSVDAKVQLVAELLASASPAEAKFIVRTVLDELRIGLGEGVLRDALVWAFLPNVLGISVPYEKGTPLPEKTVTFDTIDILKSMAIMNYSYIHSPDPVTAREIYNKLVARVQHAIDLCNDFGVVAKTLLRDGYTGLKKISLKPGNPIKVMLALKEDTIAAGFIRVGKPAALEHKLDGFRLQIHKSKAGITLFTRRLENVTLQFPDVVKLVNAHVNAETFILDAEAVGIDVRRGKFLPFQQISQRIRRKYDIEPMAKEFPVQVQVFDILYLDGKDLIKTPFKERRALLEKIITRTPGITPITNIITNNEAKAQEFYAASLNAGNEGIMMKKLDAPYRPGARVGYMIKLKSTMETLDLVIIGAEWGEGKRSAWLSSYIIACRDEETGELKEVGRVSTGLKEKPEEGLSFHDLTTHLKQLILKQEGREVTVTPKVVIEVSYEEIQISPSYASGFALRFPRIVRIREDRDEKSCSTLKDVRRLFDSQN